jgi:hypothetical protein
MLSVHHQHLKILIHFQEKINNVFVMNHTLKLIWEVSHGLKNTGEVSDGKEKHMKDKCINNKNKKD